MYPLLQSVQLALQNAEQKEAIAFIDKVVDFCIEHENGKVLGKWSKGMIRLLVAYHMAKDTCIVEKDEEGNITGLGMWYNCNEDDDESFIENWIADDPDGNAIFMAFLFSNTTKTFKQLTHNFINKCPGVMQKKLLGIRRRKGSAVRVEYSPKVFKKIQTI